MDSQVSPVSSTRLEAPGEHLVPETYCNYPRLMYIVGILSSRRATSLSIYCVSGNAIDAEETRWRRLWGAYLEVAGDTTEETHLFYTNRPSPTRVFSQILQEDAGGVLAFVLSIGTDLLSILFWLKINSCFWPVWINFTFSKYLLNWQTTIRWKNQLNRANCSLPPSASLPPPSSLSMLSCLSVLIDYFHTNYSINTQEQRWEVCLMWKKGCAESTIAADEGLEKETKQEVYLHGLKRLTKYSSCQLTGTPEHVSHQRLLNVLLYYHSLDELFDKLPGKRWQGCSNNKLDKVHSLCTTLMLECPSKGAWNSLSHWSGSAHGKAVLWHRAAARTIQKAFKE